MIIHFEIPWAAIEFLCWCIVFICGGAVGMVDKDSTFIAACSMLVAFLFGMIGASL